VNATEQAMNLGNRLYANTILMGATLGTGIVPIGRDSVMEIYKERFADPKVYEANISALDLGISLTKDR